MANKKTISDKQKKLQGQSRFVKNIPDVKPITKLWPTPKTLQGDGANIWQEIGNILVKAKVLTDLDRPAFTLLCSSYQTISELDKILKKEGYVITGDRGIGKAHPAANIRKNTETAFINLLARFGLSPIDRSKIDLPVDTQPEDKERDFIFGKKT